MNHSLFKKLKHPFIWSSADERPEVLANVDEPLWHRFLEESEKHFAGVGGLRPAEFPLFCHDGDLDEVMAMAVLAYVRDDAKLWHGVGDWLRSLLDYYRLASPGWHENQYRILRGEPVSMPHAPSNPRQFFEGFTRGVMYHVEAGLNSVVMHLLDLLETYAADELNEREKEGVLEAVGDYAARYAFHEEAVKYNNRAAWCNAGVLLSAIAHRDTKTAEILLYQSTRRFDELSSTFMDDGFQVEGASDYHFMAVDAQLAYALTASRLEPSRDYFAARKGSELFQRYPSFVDIVRAYLRTVIPGPVLWNHPRGCSVSTAMMVRPALVYAWKLTGDPEIGWFLRERMVDEVTDNPTPLGVTRSALLGLGHYQPLLNFWLYRPVDTVRQPGQTRTILPDHGAFFSRSGWGAGSSCVTARYGYEGTGKGHRDHAHVSVTVGGVEVLKDPFPRCGPKGLDSSLFHNTVTLDNHEPAGVLGGLQAVEAIQGAEAFLISNSGGKLPGRAFLHDPREYYWFTNVPETADFQFRRAILHVHDHGVVILDRLAAERERQVDWFFHSALAPAGYDPLGAPRTSRYQLRQRNVITPAEVLEVLLRGKVVKAELGVWSELLMGEAPSHVHLSMLSLDSGLQIETGHWKQEETRSADGISFKEEIDYFIRIRTQAKLAHAVWSIFWGETNPVVSISENNSVCKLHVGGLEKPIEWTVDFNGTGMALIEP